MGLLLLVTDSIFDTRKYVFKSGRKKHAEKKAFLLYPTPQTYSILKVKKAKRVCNGLDLLS